MAWLSVTQLPNMAIVNMVNYSVPYWEHVFWEYHLPVILALSLIAWILSGRRWNAYAYWAVVAYVFIFYALRVYDNGWNEVVIRDPFSAPLGTRDGMIRWARILDWTVVILSLSAPIWRNRVRRWLGLSVNAGLNGT